MKKLYILFISVGLIMSCNDYDLEEQGFVLEELPGYVAFDADGTTITNDAEDEDECSGNLELNVELPTGTLTDVTVNYAFGGTAVYGVDFTDPNGTASGGSIVLDANTEDFLTLVNGDIEIDVLQDASSDGDKVLTVTLTSAVDADGNSIAIGRGGMDILKEKTINISDVDFTFTVPGTYNYTMTGDFGDRSGVVVVTEEIADAQWRVSDFAGNIFGVPVSYQFNKECGPNFSAPATDPIEEVSADMTGSIDTNGVLTFDVTLQCCGAEGAEWELVLTPQ